MLNLLATAAVIYLVLVVLLLVFERNMVFLPNLPGRLTGDWNPPGLPVEDAWLTASDGVRIHAWWIPAPGADFTDATLRYVDEVQERWPNSIVTMLIP